MPAGFAPNSFRVVNTADQIRDDFLSDTRFKLPDGTWMSGPDALLAPSAHTTAMQVNSGTKVFSYRFDEAMRDNFVAARAMRRDAFLRGLMEERILPTINRRWQLEVDNERDPQQKSVRDALTSLVQQIGDFDAFKRAALDAVWFGRAGVQWAFDRDPDVGNLWGLSRWDPIHGDSVQFTFGGTPAILLDSQTAGWYSHNGAKIGTDGDIRPTDRGGSALVLQRPYWRDRFAIHTHMREKADYFEGELAGSVQGLGLRGLVYWHYVVRQDALSWMLAYMQAVGQMDLLVFNFPSGNAEAQRIQIQNANRIIGKAAIICPRNPAGNWAAVEQISMNEAGLRALQQLVADYFDRHIERLIVGQSMSSGADKGDGLGGTGRADFAKACVPVEGSEILTRSGFKSPQDVVVGEEVLAYDAETDQCRWTPLLKKSFFEDCPIDRLSLAQNKFEAFCTPDHSWAVEKTAYGSDRAVKRKKNLAMVPGPRGALRPKTQKRYLQKAFSLTKKENIILAAPETETVGGPLTPTEAAVLGWVITDGGIKWSDRKFKGRRCRAFICQSKEEYIPVIRKLMVEYQGGGTETVFHTKSRTFPMSGRTSPTKPQHSWDIPHERATALFKKCGFQSRADLPGIVTRLSAPARAAMLEAMMMGDGSKGGAFTNTDPHIMEAFEILCALQGTATGKLDIREKDPRYKQCFDKNMRKCRYAGGSKLQREDAGRADVWCPTTKYGTWVMRQNGRVMITGNTKDEILIYDTGRLDSTLTRDLIGPLKKYNFPWAKFPVRFKSTMPDLDKAAKVSSGAALIQAGVAIKVDEWREAAGFTKPEPGDEVIGGPPQMPMMGGGMGGGMPGMGGPPMLGAGAGGPPALASRGGPHGGPNRVYGAPALFAEGAGGGAAPAAGPAMGYPGGSNTYLPGYRRRRPQSLVGFTRYDVPQDPSGRTLTES